MSPTAVARIVVLGGGGFIGRAVRRELARVGHKVTCLDRTRAPSLPGERWEQVELLDCATAVLSALLSRADVVINCAGRLEGSGEELLRANALLPARMAVAMPPGVRMVHIGSAAEYGASSERVSVTEDDPARPITLYAVSKLAGTMMLAAAAKAGTVAAVVLRLFNPLGPGMPPSTMPGRAVSLIRDAVGSGAASIRMGPLDAWRDFIDLDDAARAIVSAATAPDPPDPVINLGSGRARQAREVVRAIADAAGFHGAIIEDAGLGSPRSVGVDWQQASVNRLRSWIDWTPSVSLADSAAAMTGAVDPLG